MLIPGVDTSEVGFNNCRLLAKGVLQDRLDDFHVDAEEIGQGAHIDHVTLFRSQR